MDKQRLDGFYNAMGWQNLVRDFSLTEQQSAQLALYGSLLIEWNEKFNLTAIVEPDKIISSHFYDSLALARYIDFSRLKSTADIGTGAGFPAIPLKIAFPHLTMVLVEVNNKKRTFLEYVIKTLELDKVILFPHDWRTFVRSTNYSIDCFFARASLQPEELIRIFKPSSAYQKSKLVYWASQQWLAGKQEFSFLQKEIEYILPDGIKRKYAIFGMNDL